VPAPLLLAVMALGVTLLFGLALNAILESALSGPAAGVREATFSARGDAASYQPAPNLSFAKQRPAGGSGG